MHILIKKYFIISCCIFLAAGCAFHKRFPVLRPIPETARSDAAKERAQDYFIKARDYERRGVFQMAEHFYSMAYELDPSSPVLRNLLLNQYVITRKYKQALLLIKGGRKNDALNEEEKRMVAGLYIEMQEFRYAAQTLESIAGLTLSERATLGYLYERLDDTRKAIDNYEACFRSDSQSFGMGMKLGDLYVRDQRIEKAESLYVILESRFDRKTEIVNRLGLISLMRKDTAAAIQFFKTAILTDSSSLEAYKNIAQIFIVREQYAEAVEYYRKIAELDAVTNEFSTRTLAFLYYYAKQYEEAEKHLQSLLAQRPDDFELHLYLGLVFSAQDRKELAELELQKSVALNERFTEGWTHLCYFYSRQKLYDKAIETAALFRQKMPQSPAAWRMYGFMLTINKRFDEAVEALKKALSFDQNIPEVWFELGAAYERSGNLKKAAHAFRKVLHLDPQDDAAANYLGYMWAEEGKKLDSAKILLEMALGRQPDNGAYLDSYGWIFYKMGDMGNAEKYIRQAIDAIADDPIIFSHLGDILAKKGDIRGAIEAFEKSLALGSDEKESLTKKIYELRETLQHKQEAPVLHDFEKQ